MNTTTFSTSELYELDLNMINVLLTQAENSDTAKQHIIRACKFVLEKLEHHEGLEG